MILPQPPAHEDDPLAEILDGYVAALEAGAAPSREELLARHPEFADDLKECLASLDFLRLAGLSSNGSDRKTQPAAVSDAANGVLGDFRIIRPIAHGGMGVVYEAEQISLGRRVALKVLPFATTLDAKQLRRFKNEATAAANLHHTNIVPVYSVGHDRGVHYYAMQFIDGHSLATVIEELRRRKTDKENKNPGDKETAVDGGKDTGVPGTTGNSQSPGLLVSLSTQPGRKEFFRTVVQLAVQAAEALECAHDQGIVHRDVKPANLLVDVHGKLWVTDFGLAQFQHSADLTLTGDLVGTLRYMSPEQALAKRVEVDHRTDIYSLGVTLYELLTLERAFDGHDREELLRQIAFEEPRPPRWVCKDIPIELETIVLKAMRKNPAERYSNAREVADDLRRFLDDRPVQARRPTQFQRLASWSRRHRPVVVSAAVLLCIAAIGSIVSNVLILKAERVAKIERLRAEAKSELARQAVDQMYTEVAEEWLDARPHMEPLQRSFLEKALRFYEEFAQENGADPEVRFQTANAYLRVGRIRRGFGQAAPAEEAYRHAGALLESLTQEFPAVSKYRHSQGLLYRYQSQLHPLYPPPTADNLARQTLAICQQLAQEAPSNSEYRTELAAAHQNLGQILLQPRLVKSILRPSQSLPEADKSLREALRIHETLVEKFETEPRHRLNLAQTLYSLSVVAGKMRGSSEEEPCCRQAIDLLEKLTSDHPTQSRPRDLLATCHQALGQMLQQKDRYTEAEKSLRTSGTLRDQLAAEFPTVGNYRSQAADAHHALALLLIHQKRYPDAEKAYQHAVAVAKKAADDFPGQMEHIYPLVGLQQAWAEELRRRTKLDEARAVLKDGIDRWRKALKLEPEQTCQCPLLESLYQTLARVFIDQGEHGTAARIVGERLTDNPSGGLTFWERAVLMAQCARSAKKDAQLPLPEQKLAARDYLERGRELVKKAAARRGTEAWLGNTLAWYLATCAEEELRDPRQAVKLAKEAVATSPQAGTFWNTLGAAHYRAGEWTDARKALEKSCELSKGGDGFDWYFLAMTYKQLGETQQARIWYDKALAWAHEKRSDDPEVSRLRAEAAAVMGEPEPEAKAAK